MSQQNSEVQIFGRDQIFKKDLYPLVKKKAPFTISGQRGIGKTCVFNWAFDLYQGEKVFLSGEQAMTTALKKIAKHQADSMDVDEPNEENPHHAVFFSQKMKLDDLKEAIVQGPKIALWIDDCHKCKPQLISFIRSVYERFPVFFCGLPKLREELYPLLWGKPKIKIGPIEKGDRLKLAQFIKLSTGSPIESSYIAGEGRGVPARMWAIARGEQIRNADDRVEGEEINIAPVLLFGVFFMACMRYIGKGTGQMDLQIIGGFAMVLGMILRFAIAGAMRK
jgi:hypothetical protein